jgi:hypothetical protein
VAKLRLPQLCKGKAWTIRKVPRVRHQGVECWGTCDFAKREVLISESAERHGVDLVTILHEVLHKECPFLSEEAVEHLAQLLADVIEVCEAAGILQ